MTKCTICGKDQQPGAYALRTLRIYEDWDGESVKCGSKTVLTESLCLECAEGLVEQARRDSDGPVFDDTVRDSEIK